MANQYDTNLKLQAIADAIGDSSSSGLIQALEDIADAVAGGGGGGGSSTAGLVSDNFSETDTYDLGDYCIHNNTLYVCINAIATPGSWDLSDWQATNAGIQLSSLNSAIAGMLTSHTYTTSGAITINANTYTTVDIPFTEIPQKAKNLTPYFPNYPASGTLSTEMHFIRITNSSMWRLVLYNHSVQYSAAVAVDYLL